MSKNANFLIFELNIFFLSWRENVTSRAEPSWKSFSSSYGSCQLGLNQLSWNSSLLTKKLEGVRYMIEIKELKIIWIQSKTSLYRILFKLAEPYGLVSLMLSKAKLNDCGPRRATLILMMVPFTNGNAGRFPSRPSTFSTGSLSEPRAGRAEGICPPVCWNGVLCENLERH